MNTNRTSIRRLAGRMGAGAACAAIAVGLLAQSPAMAAPTSTNQGPAGIVVASQSSASALADRPAGISVLDHEGLPVTLTTKGEQPRVLRKPASQPVVFTGLTLGKAYLVRVGTEPIGAVVPVTTPGAASKLLVSTTVHDGQVALTWRQATRANTGPVTYQVTATAAGYPTLKASIANGGMLSGLDLDARYTFTVTPYSTAGSGKPAIAIMKKSLRELGAVSGTPVADIPTGSNGGDDRGGDTPDTPTTPASPSAPGQPNTPVTPRTRIVMVCPDGYADAGSVCTKTAPYTYTTIPYTYHPETRTWTVRVVDAAVPMGDVWQPGCADGWCPTAWHDEVRSETTMVKDATPAGYTDTGSAWTKRDSAPAGYTDDGSQWVTSTSKVATEVPA